MYIAQTAHHIWSGHNDIFFLDQCCFFRLALQGQTCTQAKTLSDTENEAAFHRLAKAEEWSQGPNCKHMVERIGGSCFMPCFFFSAAAAIL